MPLSSVVGAQSIIKPGVCTSSTRPAVPFEGQMIYETDTDKVLVWNGSAWYANWNLPWGLVAYTKTSTTDFTFTTEVVSITSSSFTAVANRYYKATYIEGTIFANATAACIARLRLDTLTGTLIGQSYSNINASFSDHAISTGVFTTTAGSHVLVGTLKADAAATGTGYRTNIGASIIIEDIGPA